MKTTQRERKETVQKVTELIKTRKFAAAYRFVRAGRTRRILGSDEVEFLSGKAANFLGRYPEAIKHFMRAISTFRGSGLFWYWIADTILELGEVKLAIKFIDKSIALLPKRDKYFGWTERALILRAQGEYSEAAISMERAIHLSKRKKQPLQTVADRHFVLADLYRRIGRLRKARIALDRAIDLCPGVARYGRFNRELEPK